MALAGESSDIFIYKEVSGGYAVRLPKNSTDIAGVVTVPATYSGKPVVALTDSAFYGCAGITEIHLPASVSTIGLRAFFKDENLSRISVDSGSKSFRDIDGVLYTKTNALVHCPQLYAGEGGAYTVPEGTVSLGYGAFHGSTAITSISLPASLSEIKGYVFSGASALQSIEVAEGNTAFASADGVLFSADGSTLLAYPRAHARTSYTVPEGVAALESAAMYSCANLAEVALPASLTTIKTQALAGCAALDRLTLPEGVDSIWSSAFTGSPLTELTVMGVTPPRAAKNAFTGSQYGSTTLRIYTSRPVYADAPVWGSFATISTPEDYLTFTLRKDGETYTVKRHVTDMSGVFEVPARFNGRAVTALADSAFYGCAGITEIRVPASVTSIGMRAFFKDESLGRISIDTANPSFRDIDGVLYTKTNALVHCPQLYAGEGGAYTVPEGTVSLGYGAFHGSTAITSISLPASLSEIKGYVFSGASALQSIEVAEGNTAFASADGVLFSADGSTLLAYPRAHARTSYTVPEGVAALESAAMYSCANLAEVALPASLTTIKTQALAGCAALDRLTLPEGVDSIWSSAFTGSPLTELTVMGVTPPRAAKNAFTGSQYGSTTLRIYTSRPVYADAPVWGSFATISTPEDYLTFTLRKDGETYTVKRHVTDMSGVFEVPARFNGRAVTALADSAFYGCAGITEIRVPASVTSIGMRAFFKDESLGRISIDTANPSFRDIDGVLYTKTNALVHCPQLYAGEGGAYTVPEGTVSLGYGAFHGSTALSRISLPASLSEIGGYVFSGAMALESIEVAEGNAAFAATDGVLFSADGTTLIAHPRANARTEYTVPAEVTALSSASFYGSANLNSVELPGVTKIGTQALFQCTGLKDIALGEALEEIGERAFAGCTSIEVITLPAGLRSVGKLAFASTALSHVVMRALTPPALAADGFTDAEYDEAVLWVPVRTRAAGPARTRADYVAHTEWGQFKHISSAPASITLDHTQLDLKVGYTNEQQRLVATSESGEPVKALWSSSDPAVASVDADGTVTALSHGTAVITATSPADPAVYATADVNVQYIFTAIDEISADTHRGNFRIYTPDGRHVADGRDGLKTAALEPGVYILRYDDGHTAKVSLR
ncbi:MAG: leucine-rich repeat protein [Bacteroides sp.]|nr:leucine-rich repeat protein [Bacteroides sp.]MCM1094882.1 leucine-rich repeat protein [Terasakiella sp.]